MCCQKPKKWDSVKPLNTGLFMSGDFARYSEMFPIDIQKCSITYLLEKYRGPQFESALYEWFTVSSKEKTIRTKVKKISKKKNEVVINISGIIFFDLWPFNQALEYWPHKRKLQTTIWFRWSWTKFAIPCLLANWTCLFLQVETETFTEEFFCSSVYLKLHDLVYTLVYSYFYFCNSRKIVVCRCMVCWYEMQYLRLVRKKLFFATQYMHWTFYFLLLRVAFNPI